MKMVSYTKITTIMQAATKMKRLNSLLKSGVM